MPQNPAPQQRPGPRTVFQPGQWPDRQENFLEWLRANHIDPRYAAVAPITIDTEDGQPVIRYTAYLRDSTGHKYRAPGTSKAAQEQRTVPLLVEPPEQWVQA